jgi:hypothetical protein
LNDDLDWDKIGLIVKIAAFFVDRNFVNNPNGWHNGLDYGMSAYPIITTKDYNNPASKQYALSSQPIPGASQYYVVGSTSLRVDTSSSYFTVDFIVHDRASAGISTLKNNNVPLVEALNWDGTMRYADYWEYSVTSTGTANEYNLRCGIAIPVNATSGKISYATVYLKNKNSGVIAKMVNVMIVSI